ncbi:polyphenol oxidase family protein [Pseudokineococcus sp. 1T1Z-3]|uniref:polyphenol oxidase family protein n=1 Tax=Pseudokineococcus sp. 1T1Z-3 TaxID=3132745 RepID=UPI0030AB1CFA
MASQGAAVARDGGTAGALGVDLLPWARALPGGRDGAPGAVLAHTSRQGPGWTPPGRRPGGGGAATAEVVPPAGPYAGLDLALHVGDDERAVLAARAALAADLAGRGARSVQYLQQVHGADVAVLREEPAPPPAAGAGPGARPGRAAGDVPAVDAAVTDVPGLALAVLVADCVPVLLADPAAGVVGVAHAGRRGAVAGTALRALEAMRVLGARDVVAVLGPSICGRCYEVPLALREEVAAVSPVAATTTWEGGPALDVAAVVLEQLHGEGVPVEQLPGCTAERADLWSYRRDGAVSGRLAGLAWVPA